jgi:hypothetical protein
VENDIFNVKYAEAYSQTILEIPEAFTVLFHNINIFIDKITLTLQGNYYLYAFVLICFLSFIYQVVKFSNNLLIKISTILLLPISFLLVFIHLTIFLNVKSDYRVLVGFGAFLSFCTIVLSYQIRAKYFLLLALPIVATFTIHSYALYDYKQYLTDKNKNIISDMQSDIQLLAYEKNIKNPVLLYLYTLGEQEAIMVDGHPIFFSIPYMNAFVLENSPAVHFNLQSNLKSKQFTFFDVNKSLKLTLAQDYKKEVVTRKNYSIFYDDISSSFGFLYNDYASHTKKALKGKKLATQGQEFQNFTYKYKSEFDIYLTDSFLYLASTCDELNKWRKSVFISSVNKFVNIVLIPNMFRHNNECIASLPIADFNPLQNIKLIQWEMLLLDINIPLKEQAQ